MEKKYVPTGANIYCGKMFWNKTETKKKSFTACVILL